jgi:hypothetical protein
MRELKLGESYASRARLQEIQGLTTDELLEMYHIVQYSEEDIEKINTGLKMINEVLEKNTKKIMEVSKW